MQPTYLAEGTTPMAGDGRRKVLEKLVGVYQNKSGALPHNNPTRTDTIRQLRVKLTRAIEGI